MIELSLTPREETRNLIRCDDEPEEYGVIP